MGAETLQVLLIENDKLDQLTFRNFFEHHTLYDHTLATSLSEARDILENHTFDVILADYLLDDGTALDLLDSLPDTPVIVVTGQGNEHVAVEAMKRGARDYLIKDPERNYLKVLPHVIENAVKFATAQQDLRRYRQNLEQLVAERTDAIAADNELLAVTLAGMSDAVVAVDADRSITLLNKAAEKLTGYRAHEISGRAVDSVLQIVDGLAAQPLNTLIDSVLRSHRPQHGSNRDVLVARDGSEHPVSITAAPIPHGSAPAPGLVIVLRDAVPQRQVEQIKTDFISAVAQQLRTPLSDITRTIHTLLTTGPGPITDDQRSLLESAKRNTQKLDRLINGILNSNPPAPADSKPDLRTTNLNRIAEDVYKAMAPLAAKKQLNLSINLDKSIPKVKCDKNQIARVITDLVKNAITCTKHGNIRITTNTADNTANLSVTDTGPGIKPQDLPRPAGPSTQSTTPDERTRHDLALCREIIDAHHGCIWAQADPSGGTTIHFSLPLKERRKTPRTTYNLSRLFGSAKK